MNEVNLPVELVHHIVNYLLDGRSSIWRDLSLISRRFRVVCQAILFEKLVFKRKYTRETLPGRKFLSIVQGNPRIASYVREIRILDSDVRGLGVERMWMSMDDKFGMALGLIPRDNVRKFALQNVSTWECLPLATRAAIASLCSSSNLASLHIVCAPMQLLQLCGPSLEHLRLENPCVIGEESLSALGYCKRGGQAPPLSLKTLQLSSCDSEGLFAMVSVLLDPLKVNLGGLQRLCIDVRSIDMQDRGSINLSSFEGLRAFSFWSKPKGGGPLSEFVELLGTVPKSAPVERIHFHNTLGYVATRHFNLGLDNNPNKGWANSFDSFVAENLSTVWKLKKVKLEFYVLWELDVRKELFPKLGDAGILELNVKRGPETICFQFSLVFQLKWGDDNYEPGSTAIL
ncbi:hypothetical protein FA15DRAFT_652684 [Coprinopsis marcescibilis]|uniref:F-box domain-containing protein n=1 Tax=Coprinopsis marcescibilis TaxID=230819 RepID=A0A5C3L7F1_COPMA|nr:hypothetical protein FA15DRAFT_652684 [Coprinopsis marcescibilis]